MTVSLRSVLPSARDRVPVSAPVRGSILQRRCACGQHSPGGGTCGRCAGEAAMLHRMAIKAAGPVLAPPLVHDVVRSAGQPLDGRTLSLFETRFGRDFSHVRVHSDARAAQSAAAVDALAYTHRNHIVFGAGQYVPTTASGRALLGHELTHTIQQSASSASSSAAIEIGAADSAAEHEAVSASLSVQSGPALVSRSVNSFTLQRQAPAPSPAPAGGTKPEDFGIAVVVMDHGAGGVRAAAEASLRQVFYSLSPANLAEIQARGVTRIEMHVIPYDQKLTDLTEFAGLRNVKTHDGRLYDDIRGVGGEHVGSAIRYAVGEESLPGSRHGHGAAIALGIVGGIGFGAGGAALGSIIGDSTQKDSSGPGGLIGGILGGVLGSHIGAGLGYLAGNAIDEAPDSGYGPGHVAAHEGTHNIELFALTPPQRIRVDALYQARKAAGGPWLPPADYTSSTIHEYFANCASALFSAPRGPQEAASYTPQWLRDNDPDMYVLLDQIFSARPREGATAMRDAGDREAAAA